MQINQRQEGDVTVVAPAGRLDAQSAGSMEAHLSGVLGQGTTKVLIDMAGVEYISSAGLRVLLATAKKSAAAGGKLALCALAPNVAEVFEVAGFTAIFDICSTAQESLAGF